MVDLDSSGGLEIPNAQDPHFASQLPCSSGNSAGSDFLGAPVGTRFDTAPIKSVPFSALKLALNERGFDITPGSEEVTRLPEGATIPPPLSDIYAELRVALNNAIDSLLGAGGSSSLHLPCDLITLSTSGGAESSSPTGPPCKTSKGGGGSRKGTPSVRSRKAVSTSATRVGSPTASNRSTTSSARECAREYFNCIL